MVEVKSREIGEYKSNEKRIDKNQLVEKAIQCLSSMKRYNRSSSALPGKGRATPSTHTPHPASIHPNPSQRDVPKVIKLEHVAHDGRQQGHRVVVRLPELGHRGSDAGHEGGRSRCSGSGAGRGWRHHLALFMRRLPVFQVNVGEAWGWHGLERAGSSASSK